MYSSPRNREPFTVTMAGVLRDDFNSWLYERGLRMASTPPGTTWDTFIVVPDPTAAVSAETLEWRKTYYAIAEAPL